MDISRIQQDTSYKPSYLVDQSTDYIGLAARGNRSRSCVAGVPSAARTQSTIEALSFVPFMVARITRPSL
jgi:hypothetical protein